MTEVPLPKNLTPSSCEVLDGCTLRFLFSRMKLKPEPREIDYGLPGKILHQVISGSFRRMKRKDLEKIIDPAGFIREEVMKVIENIEDPKLLEDNLQCVEHYIDFMETRFELLENKGILAKFLPKENEVTLKAVINDVPFSGRLDAIFDDTAIRLIDWKSSKPGRDYKEGIRIREAELRQATRYVMLYNALNGTRVSDFYMINLKNEVAMSKSKIIITDLMIEKEAQHIKKRWEIACGNIFIKNPNGGACFFCDHKIKCKNYPDIINITKDL